MSTSSPTDRLASPRRVQPRRMVTGLLLAVGLLTLAVVIASSSTTSIAGRMSARPTTINTPPRRSVTQPMADPMSPASGGTFRDPVTHALLAVGSTAAPQAAPGLGHR